MLCGNISPLFNDPICPRQEPLWQLQIHRPRGLQISKKLKDGWLFDWGIHHLRPPYESNQLASHLLIGLGNAWTICQEAALLGNFRPLKDSG